MDTNRPDLVQSRNPKSGRYVLIDRAKGQILESKETDGPYEGVPISRRKRRKHYGEGEGTR